MILPPPIVVALDAPPPHVRPWTSYVTPASTWKSGDVPVKIAFATPPPPSLLDAQAVAALDVASRAWETPGCTAIRFLVEASRPVADDPAANGKNDVVVHLSDWPPPLANGAAAHTVIYTLGDRIVEADVHLNARDFTFALGKAPPKIDLRSILTHELGHVLGIGHSTDTRATMAAGLLSGIAARSLEKDDVEAVCTLYPAPPGPPHGCAARSCPAGFACIGFACEQRDEPSTTGAPCDPPNEPRRCEASGDDARCVSTSLGDRCAPFCKPGADCGVGLRCTTLEDFDTRCLPLDAAPLVDAGPTNDAANDADARPPASEPSSGCSCSVPVQRRDRSLAAIFVALALAWARRR